MLGVSTEPLKSHLEVQTFHSRNSNYILHWLNDHLCEQVSDVLHNLSHELDWETVTNSAQYLAWSYLQTNEFLAHLAETLPPMSLYLLAENGDQLDLSTGPVGVAGGLMDSLGQSLSDYSARHCPDTRTVLSCVNMFRSHLTQHGHETMTQMTGINFNILRLNAIEEEDMMYEEEEPLYVLAGEWAGSRIIMYEETREQRGNEFEARTLKTGSQII